MRPSVRIAAVAAAALVALPARAAPSCTLGSIPSPATFGTYNPFSPTPLDVTLGSIVYTCSQLQAGARVTLGKSLIGFAGYSPRRMYSGWFGSSLDYNVYTSASRTTIWGDGTSGTATVTPANGTNLSIPLYGRIPAAQMVPAGNYNDWLTVTFNF